MSAPAAASGPGAPAIEEAPPTAELCARVLAARQRLESVAHRTPVATSRTLDARVGATVFLKCESLQRAGAFKFRGAFNTIAQIPDDVRRRGVIAFSSGNHGQAVALVARMHGVPATIVMPSFAPPAKIEATRGYGADIVYYDHANEDRDGLAARLSRERGMTLVPPFDHPDILAGQGTAALELLEETGPLDVLITPCGGGGLLSGSSLAAQILSPACRVIGVEPAAGDDGNRSFRSGRLERITVGETIADGARTPQLGTLTFAIIRRHVSDMTVASDGELIDAMRFVWERMKLIVEPTGVLGLAALLAGRIDARGKRVGIILSGGNVDMTRAASWMRG